MPRDYINYKKKQFIIQHTPKIWGEYSVIFSIRHVVVPYKYMFDRTETSIYRK